MPSLDNHMTPAEIAGYIGAAAWLPIIISWLYKIIVKPHVTIIPDEYPEIGFTTFGPIVNVRMAITTARKPVVIDSIDLKLTHQDGESRVFHWSGMNEQVSQIVDAAGNRQTVEKETNPIAFLIGIESVLVKFVRFQDRSFNQEMLPMLDALAEKVHFGLRQKNYSHATLKRRLCGAPVSDPARWSSSFNLPGDTLKRELQLKHAGSETGVPVRHCIRPIAA